MLFKIVNNRISGFISISDQDREASFLEEHPNYIKTDFNFTEPHDLYEYDGTTFHLIDGWEQIKAEREAERMNASINESGLVVPNELTARQARLALHNIGKLADVPAAIAALPEPQKTQAEIEWEYATHIERSNPFVAVLAGALGLTDEQLDQLFIDGAAL